MVLYDRPKGFGETDPQHILLPHTCDKLIEADVFATTGRIAKLVTLFSLRQSPQNHSFDIELLF